MMIFNSVRSKTDFVTRYRNGEFGNASPTWNTFAEFEDYCRKTYHSISDSAYGSDRFHLRNRIAGGPTHYDQTAYSAFVRWIKEPNKSQWYCSAMAPTSKTLFQGEVQRGCRGLELFYSCQPKTMREALAKDGKQVYGVVADQLIKHFLPANDHDWLMGLLERYPDHVVEFSTYSEEFGTITGFKTVFWECRLY